MAESVFFFIRKKSQTWTGATSQILCHVMLILKIKWLIFTHTYRVHDYKARDHFKGTVKHLIQKNELTIFASESLSRCHMLFFRALVSRYDSRKALAMMMLLALCYRLFEHFLLYFIFITVDYYWLMNSLTLTCLVQC